MQIFSIKNEKMEYFNKPIFAESSNEALSLCQNILMSDADRVLLGLKDDLALYFHGEVDFVTGSYDMLAKPKKICDLRELFDSIPEDKIPRTERQLLEMIRNLGNRIDSLEKEQHDSNVCVSKFWNFFGKKKRKDVKSDDGKMHGDEKSVPSV